MFFFFVCVFFFKKKTAYEMRISDWSSDVCSSDLAAIEKLKGDAIDEDAIAALLGASLVAPVLTAHPTEVRRKSVLDHKNRVAELMRMRDAGLDDTPRSEERRVGEGCCRTCRVVRAHPTTHNNQQQTPHPPP